MEDGSTPIVITAKNLPKGFEHEAGMHRIQRVPPTEQRGRVHTSTVAVAILDEGRATPLSLHASDLHKRWHSGTGAGGQHRNKTQNCLELTHLPTGLQVSANGRSRKDNERRAIELLKDAVADHFSRQQHDQIDASRRQQSGDRSRSGERIRTWRFQDGKVIDHRSRKTARVRDIVRNGTSCLWPDKNGMKR